jgi:hypothetical protein
MATRINGIVIDANEISLGPGLALQRVPEGKSREPRTAEALRIATHLGYDTQATETAVTSGSSVQSAAVSDVRTLRPVATAVAAMMRSCAPRGLPARFT